MVGVSGMLFFWETASAWRAVSVTRYANGWQSASAVPEGTRDEALGLNEYEREKIVVVRIRDIRGFYARLVTSTDWTSYESVAWLPAASFAFLH